MNVLHAAMLGAMLMIASMGAVGQMSLNKAPEIALSDAPVPGDVTPGDDKDTAAVNQGNVQETKNKSTNNNTADTKNDAQNTTDVQNTTPVTKAPAGQPGAATNGRLTAPVAGNAVVTGNPLTVVLGLFAIIGLIFAIAWMLRRMGAMPLMGNASMRVIAGLSVGTREKVVLIDVGGKQLLLGVAPGRVSHLYSFDEPVVAAQSQPSEFAAKIKQFMRQDAEK